MTPKEKAIELFNKYFNIIDNCHPLTDINISAKKCALIAVDEIMQHAENSYYNEDIIKGAKLYWQEVKQEIEKL
jgi:hypothetical protein